ncbi:hypothetical protein GUJ93_ZPchr0363g33404 [Zizania palustris]|uniref:Uncharacterized protein n=1 Tax=Zizania palustris TaxID=103762 RepID=A0A8J6C6J7_ZIZPA|nr:hypothetical protein GUJ93_ZPchr0363g33404 [Zizania palustris]
MGHLSRSQVVIYGGNSISSIQGSPAANLQCTIMHTLEISHASLQGKFRIGIHQMNGAIYSSCLCYYVWVLQFSEGKSIRKVENKTKQNIFLCYNTEFHK